MYKVVEQDQVKFLFPDFRKGWAAAFQEQKQKEGEEDFKRAITQKIEKFGERLVAMDIESSKKITNILSWDIALFWKSKWSNWKRDGSPYYDRPVGTFDGQAVWLVCEPIWNMLTEDLAREEAIKRMCDPENQLKFATCRFGSANWTEFAEKFGRDAFRGTDQEEQFEQWYKAGWESFERTMDKIVELYHKGDETNEVSA